MRLSSRKIFTDRKPVLTDRYELAAARLPVLALQ
jgi:hypothetical protein